MKKDQLNLLILAGLGVGAFLIFKGGKSLLDSFKQTFNLSETPTEEQSAQQYTKEPNVNAWNPNYAIQLQKLNYPKKVYFLTQADRTQMAQDIYDAIHVYLPVAPDASKILGVFARMRYKSQVSSLAGEFYKLYKKDLLTFIDNGSPFFVGNTGLADQSMRKLLDYVNNLPSGLVK